MVWMAIEREKNSWRMDRIRYAEDPMLSSAIM
jgi:hypothetical protein